MNNRKAILILFLVMFIVMVGFGIIIPVLPFYAEKLGANTKELGFLLASYSLMQFLFSPMWGRISDRIGRKPVMMIGISGLALSFFLMAIADQLWMLFVARILGGLLSSANMPTTMAYVADITTPENRSKGMGMIGAAVGLGFVFGPAIGGIFSKLSLSFPFYVAGFLSVFTFFFVLFALKESLPQSKRQIERQSSGSRWDAFSGANIVLFFLQFFISLSLAGLETTFPYFAYNRAGLGSAELGYVFMIMGLAGAIVQGGLMGFLSEKFGEEKVIQGGIIVSILGFSLILLTTNFLTATIFISIFGIGNGVIRPAITTLLTKSTDSEQGSVTGLLSSFDSLGRIIGPPLGGALFDFEHTLPYISGILLSLVAFTLFQFYKVKVKSIEG
ncbi:MFS transporter [Fervidibacillus halotolerans]|uniref:MFS transporter n=1 Tax=Fervidibacillus halotolerans TaxID=2980027 RepID=A0A9E8RZB3_9BACI|nr:MFS transporter [Fervidibacillus halotolerans]WAA12989.1 MFS transporter [Fervidibacillus halotolerans]